MSTLRKSVKVLLAIAMLSYAPGYLRVAEAQTLCIGGVCLKAGATKRRTTSGPSQPRWTSSFIGDRQYATNGKGITVTYDEIVQLILHVAISTPFPNMTPKTEVPVSISIGSASFPVTGIVNETATVLIVTGTTVIPIAHKLKTGSSAKIAFLANDFSVRLSGSRDAIDQVELGARQYALLRKDKIDDARAEAADADIEERPQKRSIRFPLRTTRPKASDQPPSFAKATEKWRI